MTDDRLPSLTVTVLGDKKSQWIYARLTVPDITPIDYEKVGKWLLFVSSTNIDTVWTAIRQEVRDGLLGHSAKVAVSNCWRDNTVLVCVYTRDYTDVPDVMRVRKELRRLGFTQTLYYKTDNMSRAGIKGSLYSS